MKPVQKVEVVISSNAQVLMKKKKSNNQKQTRHTKIQGDMAKSKQWNKIPESDPKETQIYLLPDKEFQTTVIKKLNELKENTDN